MNTVSLIYKSILRIKVILLRGINIIYTKIILKGNNVVYKSFHTNGIPYIMVARGGKFNIGKNSP